MHDKGLRFDLSTMSRCKMLGGLSAISVLSACSSTTPTTSNGVTEIDSETNRPYLADDTDENYLRGIQKTASDGTVSFTSVYPACYSGRWPRTTWCTRPTDTADRSPI